MRCGIDDGFNDYVFERRVFQDSGHGTTNFCQTAAARRKRGTVRRLHADWADVRDVATQLLQVGKTKDARKTVGAFHA